MITDTVTRAEELHELHTLVTDLEAVVMRMQALWNEAYDDAFDTFTPTKIRDETRARIDDLVDAVRRWTGPTR